MAEAKVHVRYVGNGKQFFIDVPARDMTKDEFDGLSAGQRRNVEASNIYEFVGTKASPKKDDQKSQEGENN